VTNASADLPAWLWPFSAPERVREHAWAIAGVADPWTHGARALLAAIAAGVLPLALSWAFRINGHQLVSAAVLALLCLACVRRDAWRTGIAVVLLAFAAHSAAAMEFAALDPAAAARIMPGAADYWSKQQLWIRTGWDPEYEAAVWIPAHLGQLGGAVLNSYVSLGWITFSEGFRQVDWMNFYGAQLMGCSRHPAAALLVGWHVWSLARGLGFAVLIFEVLSLSLGRLTGRELSRPRLRRWRWTAGLSLLAADAVLKVLLLGAVQRWLLGDLR
jgi:hypothetical protein